MADENDKIDGTDIANAKQFRDVMKELVQEIRTMRTEFVRSSDAADKISKLSTKTSKDLDDVIEKESKRAAILEAIAQKTQDQQRMADSMVAAAESELKISEAQLERLRRAVELSEKDSDLYKEKLDRLREAEQAHGLLEKRLETELLHTRASAALTDDIADTLLGMAGIGDKLGMSGAFAAAAAQGRSFGSVLGEVTAKLSDAKVQALALDATQAKLSEGIMALVYSGMRQAIAVDEQTAAMSKLTGGMREYDSMIVEAYESQTIFGVSADQAGAAAQTLFMQTSKFTRMSKTTQTELVKTSALLDQAGISSETFASSLQMSTLALGRSAEEARVTQVDLLRYSRELGMAPQVMADEFAKAGPMLTKFSYNAEKEFKELARQAKATGMEIGRIIDFGAQFDTFEGASEQVGALNAMLGGDFVNAMDLMAAESPADRMRMISDAINDAGKSFEELSYYEKMALAEAGGFKDTEELAAAMAGTLEGLAPATAEQVAEQERLEAIAASNQSTMDMLQSTIASAAPAMNSILNGFRSLLELLRPLQPYMDKLVFAFIALKGVMFAAQVKQAMFALGLVKTTGSTTANTGAQGVNKTSTLSLMRAKDLLSKSIGRNTGAFIANTKAAGANGAALGAAGAGGVGSAGAAAATSAGKFAGLTTKLKNAGMAVLTLGGLLPLLKGKLLATGVGGAFAAGGLKAAGAAALTAMLPFLKIIGILALVGIALYVLVAHFDKVTAVLMMVVKGIANVIIGLVNAIIGVVRGMVSVANLVPGVNFTKPDYIDYLSMDAQMAAFEKGGSVTEPTTAIVGEKGPEIMTVGPKSASIAPATQSTPAIQAARAMAQGKGGTGGGEQRPIELTINTVMDGKVLSKKVVEITADILNPAGKYA